MLINSAQKMPSIQRRISIEFRNPAHQLSANILDSYMCRYLYLPSVSSLIHDGCIREELFDNIMHRCYDCPHFAVCILCLVW